MNIKDRSKWGMGRAERMRAADQQLDQIIAKLETTERLKLKPHPKSWGGRAQLVYNSRRLTQRMRRSMITLRLSQLASQHANADGSIKLTRAFTPRKDALAIPELEQVWRARTHERLQQALDNIQCALLRALESDDPRQRLSAARLMLKTKQGRERGFRTSHAAPATSPCFRPPRRGPTLANARPDRNAWRPVCQSCCGRSRLPARAKWLLIRAINEGARGTIVGDVAGAIERPRRKKFFRAWQSGQVARERAWRAVGILTSRRMASL